MKTKAKAHAAKEKRQTLTYSNPMLKHKVKLRSKVSANGSESLYLDYTLNGKRVTEYLELYLPPERARDQKEKERRKTYLEKAEFMRYNREQEVFNETHGIEVSSFTGREPDEERYGFDRPRFDSWSTRLSVNPSRNLARQVSRAWIQSPEALEADANVTRTTASAVHSAWLGPRSFLYTTAVWGLNQDPDGHHPDEHSTLLEHTAQLDRWAVYGRYEWIQKSAEELALDEAAGLDHDIRLKFSALTLGTNYIVARKWNTELRLGTQATYNTPDERVQSVYGSNPWAVQVYLRLTPGLLRM